MNLGGCRTLQESAAKSSNRSILTILFDKQLRLFVEKDQKSILDQPVFRDDQQSLTASLIVIFPVAAIF